MLAFSVVTERLTATRQLSCLPTWPQYCRATPAKHSRCHRWAVVLAGGDGQRLLSLTRIIAGDDRPKQFCALVDGQTLLHQTLLRTARLAPLRRTLLVLTRTHERFYSQQLSRVHGSRFVIQPDNRGTAPAILYSLMRLYDLVLLCYKLRMSMGIALRGGIVKLG